jgi:hypothetical protein
VNYTFLEEYRENIEPRIEEIDIYLKAGDGFSVGCVARLLSLCTEEVLAIMAGIGAFDIDRRVFLHIMATGSSRICDLFRRELALNSPPTYTSDDISYIYNLDLQDVKNAYQKLQIREATAFTIPMVFAKIPY